MKTAIKTIGAVLAAALLAIPPLVQALLALMILDVLSGLAVGSKAKKLSSDVSYAGIRKKALVLIIVAAVHFVVRSSALDLPVDATAGVAGFFCLSEFLSILENAALLGVPLPAFLLQMLAKRKPKGEAKA